MLSLVRVGYVAAIRQFAAVFLIGLAVVTFTKVSVFGGGPQIDIEQSRERVSLFFSYADLLTAIAIISTCNRSSLQTADSIRRASRSMHPPDPKRAADILQSLLWIPTIGLAILSLKPPPTTLVEACNYLKLYWMAEVSWPGAVSICMAAFGAMARAASKAVRDPD